MRAHARDGVDTTTTSKEWKMLLLGQWSECCFSSTNSHESKWQPTLTLDGQPVRYSATPRFLGVTCDHLLAFSRYAALVGNSLWQGCQTCGPRIVGEKLRVSKKSTSLSHSCGYLRSSKEINEMLNQAARDSKQKVTLTQAVLCYVR